MAARKRTAQVRSVANADPIVLGGNKDERINGAGKSSSARNLVDVVATNFVTSGQQGDGAMLEQIPTATRNSSVFAAGAIPATIESSPEKNRSRRKRWVDMGDSASDDGVKNPVVFGADDFPALN